MIQMKLAKEKQMTCDKYFFYVDKQGPLKFASYRPVNEAQSR